MVFTSREDPTAMENKDIFISLCFEWFSLLLNYDQPDI